jgi:hypothetical protein
LFCFLQCYHLKIWEDWQSSERNKLKM